MPRVTKRVKRKRVPTNKELLQRIIALLENGQRNLSMDLNSIHGEQKKLRRHSR